MQEVIEIHITGARIIHDVEGAWTVYYKNHLINTFDNKAQALCSALNKESLEDQFQQRYQKIA